MSESAYLVVTPFGTLQIEFPEDGGNVITGPDDARMFFSDMLSETTGPMGITLSLRALEPEHLTGFCDRADKGLRVIAPLGDE